MVYNASLMTLFSSRQVLSPGDSHFGLESPNDNETLSPLMEVCLGLGGLCSNPTLKILPSFKYQKWIYRIGPHIEEYFGPFDSISSNNVCRWGVTSIAMAFNLYSESS